MSLRAKLIGFFCALAVGPLAAIGIYDYVHSLRALHALIESQERAIVERVAADLRDRYTQRQSDLLLLAENAETERLYRAHDMRLASLLPVPNRAARARPLWRGALIGCRSRPRGASNRHEGA